LLFKRLAEVGALTTTRRSVLESEGYGVREKQLLCWRVIVMVLKSNGYGVRE
jgi:hypothetical protein